MTDLADKQCVPCRKGTKALHGGALHAFTAQLPKWQVVDDHHLERSFALPDFASGLALVNAIGAVAEAAGHHPDLLLRWGKVVVTLWTHAIDGLSEADFVLAAKIDRVAAGGVAQ